jgi:predicted alpha/beta superfamily hydrolase
MSNDKVDSKELVQESIVPCAMTSEPPLYFRMEGNDYDHEVLVTLPASYSVSPDRSYPVLWAMDGAMQHMLIAGIVNMYAFGMLLPEMIVVSVGHSSDQGWPGFTKREFDLNPPGSYWGDDTLSESKAFEMHGEAIAVFREQSNEFRGDKFLDFLVDELRPAIAERYRANDDHGLVGYSSGGVFAGYALVARPGDFSRYIIGAGTHLLTMELEAKYAESNKDMAARVFIAAGGHELELEMASSRIISRTTQLVENLRMRQYPSMDLKSRIYTDRDHMTVVAPLMADGLQHIYADEVAKLLETPPA